MQSPIFTARTGGCMPCVNCMALARAYQRRRIICARRPQPVATGDVTNNDQSAKKRKRVTAFTISLLQKPARTVKHRVERQDHTCGEVPEWSNGAVSKTVVLAIVPWVRIPPSPPFFPFGLYSIFSKRNVFSTSLQKAVSKHISPPCIASTAQESVAAANTRKVSSLT